MILFWSIAVALTLAALAFVLPPLLRRRASASQSRVAANAAIYHEQLEDGFLKAPNRSRLTRSGRATWPR